MRFYCRRPGGECELFFIDSFTFNSSVFEETNPIFFEIFSFSLSQLWRTVGPFSILCSGQTDRSFRNTDRFHHGPRARWFVAVGATAAPCPPSQGGAREGAQRWDSDGGWPRWSKLGIAGDLSKETKDRDVKSQDVMTMVMAMIWWTTNRITWLEEKNV